MSEKFHLESGYLDASTKKRRKDIDIKYQKSIDENELTPEVQGGQLLTMATNQNTLKKSEERVKELKKNASKEHNDLLGNAEKKAYKAYKKPATSLIQGTM